MHCYILLLLFWSILIVSCICKKDKKLNILKQLPVIHHLVSVTITIITTSAEAVYNTIQMIVVVLGISEYGTILLFLIILNKI